MQEGYIFQEKAVAQSQLSKIKIMHDSYCGYKNYLLKQIEKGFYLYLFGFGGFGQIAADRLNAHGIEILYFVDNDENKIGRQYKGIKCISFRQFLAEREKAFLIVTVGMPLSIMKQLDTFGISNYDVMFSPYKLDFDDVIQGMKADELLEKLRGVLSQLSDAKSIKVFWNIVKSWYSVSYEKNLFSDIYEENQYFCNDIIQFGENNVFVDCGAFIGDSIKSFLKNVSFENFSKAFLFELNEVTCDKLQSNIRQWCSDRKSVV